MIPPCGRARVALQRARAGISRGDDELPCRSTSSFLEGVLELPRRRVVLASGAEAPVTVAGQRRTLTGFAAYPPASGPRGTAASALSCGANLRLLGRAGQGAGRSRRRSARSTLSRGRRSALRVNPQRRAPSAANIIAMRTLITSSAEHTEQKTSVRFSIDICAPPCPVAGRLFGSHSFGAAQERSTPRRRGVSQPMSSLPRDRRA